MREHNGVLGSAESCDLRLPFPGVSRESAYFHPEPEGLRLRDLRSKNGLVQDGVRRAELLLVPGSSVQIGSAILVLDEIDTSDVEVAIGLGLEAGSSPRASDRVLNVN